jgi:urease accessory protein
MGKVVAFVFAAAFAAPVFAHPGHDSLGFVGGILHPLTGLDHLLAALVVGLWGAQLGGRAWCVVPCGFVVAMTVSAVIAANSGFTVPHFEAGIIGSLICLGALVALARNIPVIVALSVAGAFAVFHGAAHAVEGGGSGKYIVGLAVATAAIHAAGLVTGGKVVSRVLGALTALAGLTLALT